MKTVRARLRIPIATRRRQATAEARPLPGIAGRCRVPPASRRAQIRPLTGAAVIRHRAVQAAREAAVRAAPEVPVAAVHATPADGRGIEN